MDLESESEPESDFFAGVGVGVGSDFFAGVGVGAGVGLFCWSRSWSRSRAFLLESESEPESGDFQTDSDGLIKPSTCGSLQSQIERPEAKSL